MSQSYGKQFFHRLWRTVRHDIWRKLIALGFAVMIYYTFSPQMEEASVRRVPLTLELPPDILCSDELPTVNLVLKYDSRHKPDLTGIKAQLKVDARKFIPGVPYTVILGKRDFNLPKVISSVEVEPQLVSLNLERKISRKVRIEPRFNAVNKLSRDFAVGEVIFTPPDTVISGPENLVKNIQSVSTMPIPLDRSITDDFEYSAKVDYPENVHGNVDRVAAKVNIVKNYAVRNFTGLQISLFTHPSDRSRLRIAGELPKVDVVLEGPEERVNAIRQNMVRPYLDISGTREPGEYEFDLDCALPGAGDGVMVRAVYPEKIKIKLENIK